MFESCRPDIETPWKQGVFLCAEFGFGRHGVCKTGPTYI